MEFYVNKDVSLNSNRLFFSTDIFYFIYLCVKSFFFSLENWQRREKEKKNTTQKEKDEKQPKQMDFDAWLNNSIAVYLSNITFCLIALIRVYSDFRTQTIKINHIFFPNEISFLLFVLNVIAHERMKYKYQIHMFCINYEGKCICMFTFESI